MQYGKLPAALVALGMLGSVSAVSAQQPDAEASGPTSDVAITDTNK